MTKLRDVRVIGTPLVAALAVSAGLEIATDLEEGAPVAATPAVTASADKTAATAANTDNRIVNAPPATTPEWQPHPVDVDAVPVYNLSVTALSNTSADMGDPVWSPDGLKMDVVTTKLMESGSDHDIHLIILPTIRGSEK